MIISEIVLMLTLNFNRSYYATTPIQDVAPSAVRMAVATDAIICTSHLKVSFFVIVYLLPGLIPALESAATAGVLFGTAVVTAATLFRA